MNKYSLFFFFLNQKERVYKNGILGTNRADSSCCEGHLFINFIYAASQRIAPYDTMNRDHFKWIMYKYYTSNKAFLQAINTNNNTWGNWWQKKKLQVVCVVAGELTQVNEFRYFYNWHWYFPCAVVYFKLIQFKSNKMKWSERMGDWCCNWLNKYSIGNLVVGICRSFKEKRSKLFLAYSSIVWN